MTAHDVTPSPLGAHPVFEALFEGLRAHGLLPPTVPAPAAQPAPAPNPEDRL